MDKNGINSKDLIEIMDIFRNLPKQIQLTALGWALAKAGESLDILSNGSKAKRIKRKQKKSA